MITEQLAVDWLSANCGQHPDGWIWPSGLLHTHDSSVSLVRMHQAMGKEPTDLITAEFMHTVITRLLALEDQVRKLIGGNPA